MKKRGAPIKHKAASMPGVLALAVCPEYETRLRMAVNALSDGWMEEGQFNDLADTIDMLQIGMASYSRQKPDPSTAVAIDVCREAMMSIRERYIKTGKFGATGEELKATRLLADVSLDFWRRRSGVLFAFSVQQLKELRADQRDKAKQHKEETEAMNTRDNAPKLPAIDGAINAVHSLLMNSGDALSADGVAKALTIKKTDASKQLRELNGLGLLESEPRKGGTMFFRLAAVAPVSNINEMGDVSLANEGKTAEVCESVQTGSGSQAEDSPISDEVCAQMQSLNTVTSDEFSLLNVIADIRAAIGDPEGKIMLSCLADAVRAKIEGLEQDLERERGRLAACGVVAMADTPESAAKARDMKGEYRSASCDDVARRVDECMALRQIDREKVRDAIADALGCMIYCCTRAWEAWSVGTMRREDFILASEDDGILDELTAAAISAIEAKPGSAS